MKTWQTLIRRELWERRGLWAGPLLAAAFLIVLSLFARIGTRINDEPGQWDRFRAAPSLAYSVGWGGASFIILITTTMTMFGYLLDALHAERKDRSILFWRSLPVTDRDTVLAKFVVGMGLVPLIGLLAIVMTHGIMSLITWSTLGWHAQPGIGPWNMFVRVTRYLLEVMPQLMLWYAPIGAWLLLVSAWAKRATFLFVMVPPLGAIVAESMLFATRHVRDYLSVRLAFPQVLRPAHHDWVQPEATLRPEGWLVLDPQLWIGLAVAAGLLALAIRVRRYRDEA